MKTEYRIWRRNAIDNTCTLVSTEQSLAAAFAAADHPNAELWRRAANSAHAPWTLPDEERCSGWLIIDVPKPETALEALVHYARAWDESCRFELATDLVVASGCFVLLCGLITSGSGFVEQVARKTTEWGALQLRSPMELMQSLLSLVALAFFLQKFCRFAQLETTARCGAPSVLESVWLSRSWKRVQVLLTAANPRKQSALALALVLVKTLHLSLACANGVLLVLLANGLAWLVHSG